MSHGINSFQLDIGGVYLLSLLSTRIVAAFISRGEQMASSECLRDTDGELGGGGKRRQ